MEKMIGDSIGITEECGSMVAVHGRQSVNSGMMQIVRGKILAIRGVTGVEGGGYRFVIIIGEMFTLEEIMPQAKDIIARYAPRDD